MFPKRKLYKPLAIASLLLSPLSASAIGIGNIDILSHLNQPLLAQIIIQASPTEGIHTRDLKVHLASRAQHAKYGLDYPLALKSAHFEVTPQPDGNFSVRATTSYPLKEPLINFLLEVDWKNGRLLKEVALLLDPPGYQQLPVVAKAQTKPAETAQPAAKVQPQPLNEPKEPEVAVGLPIFTRQPQPLPANRHTPDTETFTLADADLKPSPAAKHAKRHKHNVRRKSKSGKSHSKPLLTGNQYGPVRPGDSLSKIAMRIVGRNAPKAKIKALMKAIYVANPQAFAGSMDALEKNSYLVIPSETDVALGPSYLETSAAIGISDFVTTLSGSEPVIEDSELVGPTIIPPGKSEPTVSTEKEAPPTPQGQLKILPPDQTAAEISRKLSQRMAELDREAARTVEPVSSNEQTVDNDPAVAEPVESQSTIASDQQTGNSPAPTTLQTALLQKEIDQLKAERRTLLDRFSRTEKKLQATEDTLHKLELKINALGNSTFNTSDGGLKSLLTQWLPWLLLLPLLPLLLILGWKRRRRDEPVDLPQPSAGITATDTLDPGAPFVAENDQKDEIETVESVSRDIPAVDLDLGSLDAEVPETEADADSGGLPLDIPELDDMSETPTKRNTTDVFGSDDETIEQPYTDLIGADLNEFDHKLNASDTQESIRPVQNTPDSEVTQIINSPEESDSSLNAAQESEIYLAYGQYSLAEENINRLLALEPDNDRHKLLQLKLFAETARMNELQTLSVDLLQKYPDPNSGMHQQINNICERAFTKKAGKETTLTDQDHVPPVDATGADTKPGEDKLPPLDLTLSNMSVEADKLSSTYNDNIDDYMSEQTLADLDLLEDDEDIEKTVFEDPLSKTSDTAPSLELENEDDLTQSDLESLTVDMELQEAKLELDATTLDRTISEDHIEEFSDTDLRLEPIDLDDPKNLQSRLDISFDLESELEKHVTKVNDDDTK